MTGIDTWLAPWWVLWVVAPPSLERTPPNGPCSLYRFVTAMVSRNGGAGNETERPTGFRESSAVRCFLGNLDRAALDWTRGTACRRNRVSIAAAGAVESAENLALVTRARR